MHSTNSKGQIAVFWQVAPATGMARFDTIGEAVDAALDLLRRCPDATIIRQA